MFRSITIFVLTAGLAAAADVTELKGVLIDKTCSYNMKSRVVAGPRIEGGMLSAYVHKRECALKPECLESGLGIFTYDQEFVPFDKEGNKKAVAFLKATKKEDDLRIVVRGQMHDGTLRVQELKLLD